MQTCRMSHIQLLLDVRPASFPRQRSKGQGGYEEWPSRSSGGGEGEAAGTCRSHFLSGSCPAMDPVGPPLDPVFDKPKWLWRDEWRQKHSEEHTCQVRVLSLGRIENHSWRCRHLLLPCSALLVSARAGAQHRGGGEVALHVPSISPWLFSILRPLFLYTRSGMGQRVRNLKPERMRHSCQHVCCQESASAEPDPYRRLPSMGVR